MWPSGYGSRAADLDVHAEICRISATLAYIFFLQILLRSEATNRSAKLWHHAKDRTRLHCVNAARSSRLLSGVVSDSLPSTVSLTDPGVAAARIEIVMTKSAAYVRQSTHSWIAPALSVLGMLAVSSACLMSTAHHRQLIRSLELQSCPQIPTRNERLIYFLPIF
jgi:hypothetical protein